MNQVAAAIVPSWPIYSTWNAQNLEQGQIGQYVQQEKKTRPNQFLEQVGFMQQAGGKTEACWVGWIQFVLQRNRTKSEK